MMADFARRKFLAHLTKFSALAAVPALGNAQDKLKAYAPPLDTVTFEVKFTGPFGFIPYEKDIYVYAPETTFEHYPAASTDFDEMPLLVASDYALSGILPRTLRKKCFPPLTATTTKPLSCARDNCRIGVKVPRPDVIQGINLARVSVDNGAQQRFPTGLRFIYYGVSKASKLEFKSSKYALPLNYQKYDQECNPVWELSIRMVPETIVDRCHQSAKLSFVEVAKLCSVQKIPSLSYGDLAHCHAPLPHAAEEEETMKDAGLLRGPGSDCQTLALWVNPSGGVE
jgi:hypothetical protein